MQIEIIRASYTNTQHQRDIPLLLNAYAQDSMGGATPLKQEVIYNIVEHLATLPHAFSVLAYVDNQPAGLVNCFEGFSTFACQPLINIHDIFVLNDFRGNGISQMLLDKVQEIAMAKGCCKITLEVLSNNEVAKASYRKFGFSDYQLTPEAGTALFWQKDLPE